MKTKASKKIGNIFFKTLNYFMIPLFCVGLFAMLIMNYSNPYGAMPHFFGINVVRIESGSMLERGFQIGDVVLMTQNYKHPLKKGDIIGFYNKEDAFDKPHDNFLLLDEFEGELKKSFSYEGRITPQDLRNQNTRVTFHEIVEVYVNQEGIVFYQTQGSNPSSSPDGLIRQDFVQAKYLHTPLVLKMIMTFTVTPLGLILLLYAPFSLIAGFEGYNALKKIYAYRLEIKMFKRKISFKDEKVKDYKINQIMSVPRKVYFWITAKKSEKEEVFNFLFALGEEPSKKQLKLHEKALEAKKVFENKGPLEYFKFWHLTTTNYFDKKEIIKFHKQYENTIKELRSKP